MRKTAAVMFVLTLFVSAGAVDSADSVFENYITRNADMLMDGDQPYRFISFNIPNLHYIEDNMVFTETNPWRLPDPFEITDALEAVKQAGGQVVRIYTLSVRKQGEDESIPRHVLGPGKYNEEAFQALDRVFQIANQVGIRIIVPFIDRASWWGGVTEFAAFRGMERDAFWTDAQVKADFKALMACVLNRKNIYTGVRYKDDKAVLAWETGNELRAPVEWTREMTAELQRLAPNHLIMDGYFTKVLRNESVDDPNTDIVQTHHYDRDVTVMLHDIRTSQKKARGKKPYCLGEFGFINTPAIEKVLDLVIDEGLSGALIWSLRFRNRDGGFYWHSEPFGGDLFKAYFWPGFITGAPYDEINLLRLMQQKAYEIRGLSVPLPGIPDPPVLLPVSDVAAISWLGSTGAKSYIMERAEDEEGPWQMIAKNVIETRVQYRPLYQDTSAELGKSYYYRITALNDAGRSEPSGAAGPVHVSHLTLVDEMNDFKKMKNYSGSLSFDRNQARKAKEDLCRLKGHKNGSIVYYVPGGIRACSVFVFFPDKVIDPVLAFSADGIHYNPANTRKEEYYTGSGYYDYWKPVKFTADVTDPMMNYLKVVFSTEMQISRIEIQYGQ